MMLFFGEDTMDCLRDLDGDFFGMKAAGGP
jgi:hypothetical protein